MKDLLEIGIKVGGVSLLLLCVVSFWIPGVLDWRKKLSVLSPLMREMWWTYAAYVLGSHLFFAILLLFFGDWLMGGTGSAIAMLSFMLMWWGVRLYLQFFGFDFVEVEPTPFNRFAKHMLSLLFICLVTLFALLIVWNMGLLGGGG